MEKSKAEHEQAKIYDKEYAHMGPSDKMWLLRYQKDISQVQKHVKIDENFRVLDIGCGDGRFLDLVPAKHKFGVDVSSVGVELAKKKGIDAHVVDVEHDKLPFESNFFDMVFCMEVLEHVFDISLLLSEIKRVLKPGGHIHATVPNEVYRFDRRARILLGGYFLKIRPHEAAHIRFFNKSTLKGTFLKEGFKVVYIGGLPLSFRGELLPLGGFLATHFSDLLPFHYSIIAQKP